jgi:hypothetical protein
MNELNRDITDQVNNQGILIRVSQEDEQHEQEEYASHRSH